ncbi:alpha/beta hydrolase [Glycomyces terrestris]|uniref:Alpha/beta fold hydrolase n=1 Tax=Glycomyces terrestris TaxID=2493553 RepID=A0A426USU3_9ACTN|nr:alpha/beta fold hydrolase [Glycomyces terrestris]RRR96781.1 alpha/beta fold hydrolase [Glycomyces terrestris]
MANHPDTIVLIHGLWMTPRSWELWKARYEQAGYRVLAPAWPGLEGEVEALRADPSPLEHLEVGQILDHYEALVQGLERRPILMGHSFGGAFVQVLLDRGVGAAGVAIASAAVKGVRRLPLSTVRSTFPVLKKPANAHKAVPLTPEQFHYAFTNTLSESESRAVYERYHVPAAGHILFEGGLANFNPHAATKVDFGNDYRAPLLFIAAELDHISPPAMVLENAEHYKDSAAVTDFKEFAGRSHHLLGQAGWEEVADYALSWAATKARTY